jgi:hypothetical protein
MFEGHFQALEVTQGYILCQGSDPSSVVNNFKDKFKRLDWKPIDLVELLFWITFSFNIFH